MTGESEVLVPVDQETVPFYGQSLVAVRLADGRIGVVLRWLCEGLRLERKAQVRRIQRTAAIASELIDVSVETEGGQQIMPALTLRALPFWLAGIAPGKVAPEVRPVILAYQLEVVDVLYQHFSQRPPQLTPPPDLVPATPITQPEPPERGAPLSAWKTYHEGMVAWIEWQADIETWRGSVEHRLGNVEEITQLIPGILERLGPATLTPEHQRTVQSGINHLHELTHRPHAALYDELRQAFHVGTYKDISDRRWAEVAQWLRTRITRAGGADPEQPTLF
jgi:hypothetical protein